MDAQRLLIAESNETVCRYLANALHAFHYVRCCSNGKQALEILRADKPDILVLDMFLPELDGLTLLETITAEGIRPMVLALTALNTEYLMASAQRLGIEYISMRPFDPDVLVSRVLDMRRHLKELPTPAPTQEARLQRLLSELDIHSGCAGYRVALFALMRTAQEPDALCKSIYADTAEEFGITVNAVESAIRRLIRRCWSPERWSSLFPDTRQPPTARAFLLRLAQLLNEV